MGRYSLWLMPGGDTARRLNRTIERLSLALGGPRFTPHMTLLGGLSGDEAAHTAATESLAASIDPITVRFQDIEFGDEPYRCLYLRITADGDLGAARLEALRQFGRADGSPFIPHVSLYYGSLSAGSRPAVAATLTGWRSVPCRFGRLRLVATGGGPTSWSGVRECDLSSPRPD